MELDDTPIAAEPHVAPPETGAVTGAETGAETGNHEVTEAREMQSDPVAAEIKADRDGKVNGGMLGAKQDAEEQRDAAQEEKKEDEKKFEDAMADSRAETRDARRREREEDERRKEWESKTHRMGGVEMSGADLEKLFNFLKSPAAIAKVEAAMKAKGASQKQIDKAQKEWQEFQDLKEKEKSDEPLTPQELKRLQEINKSQEFQQFSQTATEVARNQGIHLSSDKTAETQAAQAAVESDVRESTKNAEDAQKDNNQQKVAEKSNAFSDITSQAMASERFASAPQLTNKFTASATMPPASAPIPDVANDITASPQTNIAVAAQTKTKPAADMSFG